MQSRFLIILTLLICTSWGFAQKDTMRFSIELKDKQTDQTIESAQLIFRAINEPGVMKREVQSGDTLHFDFSGEEEWKVKARAAGFVTLDTVIRSNDYHRSIKRSRMVTITLYFKFDGQYEGEVDITATYKPKVKFGSDSLSVSDFVVLNENQLVLLTYPERLKKSSEILWYEDDEIKGSRSVEGTARELTADFRSCVYLRCDQQDYRVFPGKDLLLRDVNTRKLDKHTLPILDSLEEHRLYFSNYVSHYPAYDYFMVDVRDTVYKKIHHIEDDIMMEQYRAEYKWADVRTKLWAWDMEAETGVDREVWVGANVFTNSIYYEPPIGDFFRIDQDIVVFDYYNDQLLTFDAYTGAAVDSVTISFHQKPRKSGWEEEVIQDPVTKKLYTFFDEAGYRVGAVVDPQTGELGPRFKLHYRYVENIQLYNGVIYYIYRPFESPQKKFLYYESIEEIHKQ